MKQHGFGYEKPRLTQTHSVKCKSRLKSESLMKKMKVFVKRRSLDEISGNPVQNRCRNRCDSREKRSFLTWNRENRAGERSGVEWQQVGVNGEVLYL